MYNHLLKSIEKALSYIKGQRTSFYGEAWDIHLGEKAALIGNQFGVSLILDALLGAAQQRLVNLEEVEADITRLAKNMKDNGWRYFPNFDLIPPDADDTAQMVQLLSRINRDVSAPVSLLLSKQNADGSFKTWLRGASEADVEVTANVLYAFFLVDQHKYQDQLLAGAKFLVSTQHRQGWWGSTWYYDKFYGTYVCLRILDKIDSFPAIEKGVEFLIKSQNKDGGWGSNRSTAQDTAFSLLSLPRDPAFEPVCRGIEFLVTHQQLDGSWDAHPFFFTFGSKHKFDQPIVYKSKTVTTAYALKALLCFTEKNYF